MALRLSLLHCIPEEAGDLTELVQGLRKHIIPDQLYQKEAMVGTTIIHRCLRNYLSMANIPYIQQESMDRQLGAGCTIFHERLVPRRKLGSGRINSYLTMKERCERNDKHRLELWVEIAAQSLSSQQKPRSQQRLLLN